MSGFLLDTNVVSELSKERPEPRVIAFLRWASEAWLSSVLIHELEFGLRTLPAGRRRDRLRADLSALLSAHAARVLPVDREGATWAAHARAESIRSGRTPTVSDMLIAGTARANNLTIATRNVQDFEGLGIEIVNPWEVDPQIPA